MDVAEVGGPLGHQPAHAGEQADEVLDGVADRGEQVVAGLELLGDRRAQPAVGDQAGARREHLRGRAARGARLPLEAGGDSRDRGVVRRERGVVVGEAAVPEPVDRRGETSLLATRAGPSATPATTGVPWRVVTMLTP